MARNDYGPLREAHRQALDALNSHIDQTQQPAQDVRSADLEPTRPEGNYRNLPAAPDTGDLVSQQTYANAVHAARQEHANARDALNQHVDRTEAGEAPEKAPDITRAPENDIER